MDYKDITEKNINEHIDNIIDIANSIELNKVTILTGGNGCGKSVVRKLLTSIIKEKVEAIYNEEINSPLVASVSMETRTASRPDFYALSSLMHDLPWTATSVNTISLIRNLCNSLLDKPSEKIKDKRFIVLDEIEIGLSEEVLLGLCDYLNDAFDKIKDNTLGVLVITHNRNVVKKLSHDNFLNIEGLTEGDWLNREIRPVSLDDLDEWSVALYSGIRKREKKK